MCVHTRVSHFRRAQAWGVSGGRGSPDFQGSKCSTDLRKAESRDFQGSPAGRGGRKKARVLEGEICRVNLGKETPGTQACGPGPESVPAAPAYPALTAWGGHLKDPRAVTLLHRCDFVSPTLGMTPRSSGAIHLQGAAVSCRCNHTHADLGHIQNQTPQGLMAWLGPLTASLYTWTFRVGENQMTQRGRGSGV